MWRCKDLKQKSGQSEIRKRKNVETIVLDDDHDDILQISSTTSFAQARSSISNWSGQFIVNEEYPEFHARPIGLQMPIKRNKPFVHGIQPHEHKTLPYRDLIDLTTSNDECQFIGSTMSKRRKYLPSVGVKEPKLSCAICMDTMKEETSTICGHIFCKKCITSTIQVQQKCPTCRMKLTISKIHRIYIPGSR